MAANRAASETVRGRALSALAYARTSRAHAFLENFIIEKTPSSAPVDRVLLRRAATSLGWLGGAWVVEVTGARCSTTATPRCVSTLRRLWGWRARGKAEGASARPSGPGERCGCPASNRGRAQGRDGDPLSERPRAGAQRGPDRIELGKVRFRRAGRARAEMSDVRPGRRIN